MNLSNVSWYFPEQEVSAISSCSNPQGVVEWCSKVMDKELASVVGYAHNMEFALLGFFLVILVIYWFGWRKIRKYEKRIKELEGEKDGSKGSV